MEKILQIIGAVIVTLGGTSVVLIGVFSWLSKIWATKILETEKKKYSLEIEEYKSKLQGELGKIKLINSQKSHYGRVHFEEQYQMYKALFDKLSEFQESVLALYPELYRVPISEDVKKKWNEERFDRFTKSNEIYTKTIIKYAPFIKKKFVSDFKEIKRIGEFQGNAFMFYVIGESEDPIVYENGTTIPSKQREMVDKIYSLTDGIKEYLDQISIID